MFKHKLTRKHMRLTQHSLAKCKSEPSPFRSLNHALEHRRSFTLRNAGPSHFRSLKLSFALSLFIASPALAQKTDKFLAQLLKNSPELFGPVLRDPARYEVQILYTQIDRDADNKPSFRSYRYRLDRKQYFYPASTVKLPAVLLALETLNQHGVRPDTPMLTDSAYSAQTRVTTDTTAQNKLPSVAQYARKILLVSDNDAFNRLYELIGQCGFNERLHQKGYRDLRIVHRLESRMNADQNRHTNPVRFVEKGQIVWEQPAQVCDNTPRPDSIIQRGLGYIGQGRNGQDSLIRQPFDFTGKNFFALEDQQMILRAVMFPEAVEERQRFNLAADDYPFLYQYMSQLPRETPFPHYDPATYYDSYCKFLLAGDQRTTFPKSVRIFNKVGDAYGYLLDNAYIADFDKGIEFMLSAVIYVNSDGILNDNKYDYSTVGIPFLANLGRVVYDYERRRKRPRKPDLSRFRVVYDKAKP